MNLRVKVYGYSHDNGWFDIGTGYFSIIQAVDSVYLNVSSEEDESTLVNSMVAKGNQYQREQDDIAKAMESLNNSFDHLPPPEPGNLEEIEKILSQPAPYLFRREKLVSFIISEDYIKQIVQLYEVFDDLEDSDSLRLLSEILRHIILLNDASIVEYIVRDDIILDFVGIMEYNMNHPKDKTSYREHLSKNIQLKQIIPIKDPATESKIQQTFRLLYLKDVVLARTIDDTMQAILSSIIFFNHIEIIKHFVQDQHYMKRLFNILEDEDEPTEKKHDVILFMQQFCNTIKGVPPTYFLGIYRTLSQYGLFKIFQFSLGASTLQIQLAGAEILTCVLNQDRPLVRSYILDQVKAETDNKKLLDLLLENVNSPSDNGIRTYCAEIVRALLDTTPALNELSGLESKNENEGFRAGGANGSTDKQVDKETNEFLVMFYEKYVSKVMEPILGLTEKGIEEINSSQGRSGMMLFLCEMLIFAVSHHSYRSRYFVFSSDITCHIALLLSSKRKELQLVALRFVRVCVGRNDEFYNKYLIRNSIMASVIRLFRTVISRNNLINSACLELFDFILAKNIKSLVAHVSKIYCSEFKELEYTTIFRDLVIQNRINETDKNPTSSTLGSDPDRAEENTKEAQAIVPGKLVSRGLDASEEAYFSQTEDNEEEQPESEPPRKIASTQKSNGKHAPELARSNTKSAMASDSEDSFDGSPLYSDGSNEGSPSPTNSASGSMLPLSSVGEFKPMLSTRRSSDDEADDFIQKLSHSPRDTHSDPTDTKKPGVNRPDTPQISRQRRDKSLLPVKYGNGGLASSTSKTRSPKRPFSFSIHSDSMSSATKNKAQPSKLSKIATSSTSADAKDGSQSGRHDKDIGLSNGGSVTPQSSSPSSEQGYSPQDAKRSKKDHPEQ
ncbi:Platinum sensitivity protein [Mycoemilia scoparia]|uniref:Platinum sensitivity protein n=1 Tax=Mycoemilia scoparia TaxID=417184 RepID=A0A9W8AB99_9FUNG|nr:Platinum sensitivity protein [Mycoemilia scoparia]